MYSEKFFEILKQHIPPGLIQALKPGSDREAIYKAMSQELQRAFDFLTSVRNEGQPDKVDQLLEEWATIYNIDDSLSDADKIKYITAYYTSIGNQALNYLQTQANVIDPDILITEMNDDSFYSDICGPAECGVSECGLGNPAIFVDSPAFNSTQLEQLQELIEYYKPAHVDAVYNNNFSVSLAICNLAYTGQTRIGKVI